MFTLFLKGLGLFYGLIVAIGPQNAFVLRQGLKQQTVIVAVLSAALCDTTLIVMGVMGLGGFFAHYALAKQLLGLLGGLFLLIYGFRSAIKCFRSESFSVTTEQAPIPKIQLIMTAVAVSWLNPHAIIDTIVLLGGIAAQLPTDLERWALGLGAITATFTWFFAIGYGARFLSPVFARPLTWKILDGVIAIMMWTIAVVLLRDI